MKAIIPNIDAGSSTPYYLQLYSYLKEAILSGDIQPDEKLPSLRLLSKNLKLSMTTVGLAYDQLAVEGYIYSRPQSGYYACNVRQDMTASGRRKSEMPSLDTAIIQETPDSYYDMDCFAFSKWKKCANRVLTDFAPQLFFESDPQGEQALRAEIARYLYLSRGVICQPDQIVIGAGTQQITNQLATLLTKMSIDLVAVENPGYLPVNNIFRDRGFALNPVDVGPDGIAIEKLPSNIRSAVYVNPSNQVPSGAIMPVGRRYQLLDWAVKNNSIIIEDDYDSELRYFGKPIPALQGLDDHGRVVYLGSFSATLFSSIKISYMVLPPDMAELFQTIRGDYTQTCSKTEQLTLALFMEAGHYQTHIKKIRSLYSQKLQAVTKHLTTDFTKVKNTSSGLNIIVEIKSPKEVSRLAADARAAGVTAVPLSAYSGEENRTAALILYYNQIPLSDIPDAAERLLKNWKNT